MDTKNVIAAITLSSAIIILWSLFMIPEQPAPNQKLNEKNQNLNIWQWQHYTFEENILGSMKNAKKGMTNLKKNYFDNYNKFQLEII